jgi:hypothetical protein
MRWVVFSAAVLAALLAAIFVQLVLASYRASDAPAQRYQRPREPDAAWDDERRTQVNRPQ